MENKKEFIALCLLCVILLSAYILSFPYAFISFDSANLPNFIVDFKPGWMDGKPIYIWLGRIIYNYYKGLSLPLENFVWMLNLYSAIFGVLTCINTYFICRHLFNLKKNILAFIFTGLSPIFFFTSSSIEVYCLNLFFITLSLLLWIRERYILWGIAFGLALSSHILSILLIFAFLTYSFLCNIKLDRKIITGIFLGLLISGGCYFWVFKHYPSIAYFFKTYLTIAKNEYVRRITFHDGSSNMLGALNGVFILSALSSIALFFFERNRFKELTFLYSWLAPYFLFAFIWNQHEKMGSLGGQFFIYSSPPLAILASISICFYTQKIFKGRFLNIFSFLLMGILITHFIPTIVENKVYSKQKAKQIKYLSKDITEDSFVICGWEAPWVKFYNPKSEIYYFIASNIPRSQEQLNNFIYKIDSYLTKKKDVFVNAGLFVEERNKLSFLEVLQKRYSVSQPNKSLFKLTPK